uniref:Peptidase S26 domain-containing protein n=1 Tax=Salix viminalis TaxID=40686 RepID=A0A6N2LIX3_SALVM
MYKNRGAENSIAWKSIAKEAFTQTCLVAKFLGFLHLTNNYLFSPTLVYGPSMLPTLNLTGDVLLVEHVSHRFQKVGPGDVVLVRSPLDPTKMVTKRIVGMEGDQINFLPDPSITDICRTIMVPKGHIWIQGDNTHASCDSRHYGPVPYGLVQGKLFFREFREAEDPNKPNFA